MITRAELLYGLERIAPRHSLHEAVQLFLEVTPSLDWNAECAAWYARVRNKLTRSGELIGELDMMIAAHALALGAKLVTNNLRHYSKIGFHLQLENWMPA